MPFIKVNVMGRVSPNGNGTFYVDGRGYYNVKNGLVVYVSEGSHSVKYRTTLKGTESTASTYFEENTVMIANIIDEDFSAPDFRTHIASASELQELQNQVDTQLQMERFNEKKEKEKDKGYVVRCVFGVILILAALGVTFGTVRHAITDSIIPAVLMGLGAGLVKSHYSFGDAAKGFFGWGIGWFVALTVFAFLGGTLN
ncbi:MAG: hypothetical protein IJN78_04515 [Clostridia bacterium]|nr:hypothetical protein [Clostridia bacterium]